MSGEPSAGFRCSWQAVVPLNVIHLSAKTPARLVPSGKHSKSSRQPLNEIGAERESTQEWAGARGSRLGVGWGASWRGQPGVKGERRGWVPRQTRWVSKNNQPRERVRAGKEKASDSAHLLSRGGRSDCEQTLTLSFLSFCVRRLAAAPFFGDPVAAFCTFSSSVAVHADMRRRRRRATALGPNCLNAHQHDIVSTLSRERASCWEKTCKMCGELGFVKNFLGVFAAVWQWWARRPLYTKATFHASNYCEYSLSGHWRKNQHPKLMQNVALLGIFVWNYGSGWPS